MTLWKPTRRKLIAGAAASTLAKPALAWFPHGKSAPAQGPLVFNITYWPSWAVTPSGNFPDTATMNAATAVVQRVCQDLSTWFCSATSSTATINVNFGWGSYGPSNAVVGTGAVADTQDPTAAGLTYAQYRSILLGLPTDNVKSVAYNLVNLPVSDPGGIDLGTQTQGQHAIWNGTTMVGTTYIGFENRTWDMTVDGKSNSISAPGLYQSGVHEVTYPMGREAYDVVNIFKFSAPGVRDQSHTDDLAYLSFDQGSTNVYGTVGHFSQTERMSFVDTPTSPFNWYVSYGPWSGAGAQYWTAPDYQYMSCIGVPMTDAGKALLGI